MNFRFIAPFAVILLMAFLSAGCASLSGVDTYDANSRSSPVQVTFLNQQENWGVSRGCTYTVGYQVYNTGNTTADNVRVGIMLVHINDGVVRDSKEIYVGNLAPGQSATVTAELDGECLKDYTVRAVPQSGI
jgi:hypothetical protein